MGRKGTSYNKKLEAVEKYKQGEGNQKSIARECGVKQASFRQWIANYEAVGPSGLATIYTNNKYSRELKTSTVEAYLRGEGSQVEICKKYNIRSKT
jgi:transposase